MSETLQATEASPHSSLRIQGLSLLVSSPNTIAEACFSVPAMRALKKALPAGKVVILCPASIAPVWQYLPDLFETIVYQDGDSSRKIAKSIAAAGTSFSSALIWEDGPAAQAFLKTDIPQRLGYPATKLTKILTDPVSVTRNIGPIEHRVNHYLLFVHQLGLDPFDASNFQPPPRPPKDGVFRVAVSPGSDFGPAAEWSLERFLKVSQELFGQCELSIITAPGRPAPAENLAKALGDPSLIRRFDDDQLLNYLATCNGLMASDGSIAHLASLVGTKSVVFFGPNEPEWRRPLGRMHRILHKRVACSSCLLTKCPLDHRCMEEISVEEATKALRSLLNS